MISVFDNVLETKNDPEVERIKRLAIKELKNKRLEKEIGQSELARLTGKTQNLISRLEAGKDFQFSTYIKLCLALEVQPRITFKVWKPLKETNI